MSEDGERYVNSIIIQKNKPIPVTQRKDFLHYTSSGKNNDLEVYLTQGETSEIRDCIVAGKYIFHDIQHINGGETIICIEYSYDENGVIVVNGTQKETGKSLRVEKVAIGDDMQRLYEKRKGKALPLSIIIAVDLSGSMSGYRIQKARDAALEFLSKIDLQVHKIGIMGFADGNRMFCQISNKPKQIKSAIYELDCNAHGVGYGNDNNPLLNAIKIFDGLSNTKNVLIVLTDGAWNYDACRNAESDSDHCRDVGYDVIAIGFGGANEKFLQRISTQSENALFTNLDNLVASFGNIAQEISKRSGANGLTWKR